MKQIVLLISLLLLLGSCATKRERAVRHINKALTLDPNVLTKFNLPIRIDTNIVINKQYVTPEKKIYLKANEDSIRRALEAKLGVKTLLVENEKLKLEIQKTKDGWYEFLATVKPDTVTIRDTVFLEIEKEIPVSGLVREVPKRGYLYYCGWLLHLLIVLFVGWKLLKR